MRVSLSKHQTHKKFSVHRLVAQAYIPNPNNLPQVNHKDKNKKNNDVDNLEWCDCLYNLTYSDVISKATISKYTPVKCITTNESFPSIKEACKKYNLHYSKVSDIICHSEGYKKGIASNHGDVMHWFPKHGKSMDTFRADVDTLLNQSKEQPELTSVNDIVWELSHRGILSDTQLWLKKLEEDSNAYWLARKTVKFLQNKGV